MGAKSIIWRFELVTWVSPSIKSRVFDKHLYCRCVSIGLLSTFMHFYLWTLKSALNLHIFKVLQERHSVKREVVVQSVTVTGSFMMKRSHATIASQWVIGITDPTLFCCLVIIKEACWTVNQKQFHKATSWRHQHRVHSELYIGTSKDAKPLWLFMSVFVLSSVFDKQSSFSDHKALWELSWALIERCSAAGIGTAPLWAVGVWCGQLMDHSDISFIHCSAMLLQRPHCAHQKCCLSCGEASLPINKKA